MVRRDVCDNHTQESRADPVRVQRAKKTLLGTVLLLCACVYRSCGTGEGFVKVKVLLRPCRCTGYGRHMGSLRSRSPGHSQVQACVWTDSSATARQGPTKSHPGPLTFFKKPALECAKLGHACTACGTGSWTVRMAPRRPQTSHEAAGGAVCRRQGAEEADTHLGKRGALGLLPHFNSLTISERDCRLPVSNRMKNL